jgi:type IV pilus assembly protein PilB
MDFPSFKKFAPKGIAKKVGVKVLVSTTTSTPPAAAPIQEEEAQVATVIKTEVTAVPAVLERDSVIVELDKGSALSVVRLMENLVQQAYAARSSDIHIDPAQNSVQVRFRVDGVLRDMYNFPKSLHEEVISRLKILAGLRTDEHQTAQDGRFRYAPEGLPFVDVRVSIVPTYYGENAVLRLLSDMAEEFSLGSLGFSAENQEKIMAAVKKPYGMILATGPTGSGKTTTLYTLIKMLNNREASIITIEDPIEYSVVGINQIQVNTRTGLTFSTGLRSVLRQDPNIIMVGEIRDAETAGLAVNTALTGHLVLSTLHTNDASTTLPRLLDMKVEPYLIASTVNAAIGQRLVRKICQYCKTERKITPGEVKSLSSIVPEDMLKTCKVVYHGAGCERCRNSGYSGRVGIHEVLVMDNAVREAILQKAPASEIRRIAIAQGMTPMIFDGFAKAQKGITTIEEILRMFYE